MNRESELTAEKIINEYPEEKLRDIFFQYGELRESKIIAGRIVAARQAYPDTSFSGRVRQVVPTADRQKATVQVKVSILDRDPRILPEMGAKVVFVREGDGPAQSAPRRVRVPASAVTGGADAPAVWVVIDERVSKVAVELGPASGDRVEIRRGLQGGERIVIEPPAGLEEGMKVRIQS
jgi:multidrug efflux pump subunit AcrA (membrane-fusion protein)